MIPLTNADFDGEADLNPPVQAMREPRGPVGPTWGERKPLCKPSTSKVFEVQGCGHTWSEHDDYGCLWNLCSCPEPGERQ